jgi:hypothetical protein
MSALLDASFFFLFKKGCLLIVYVAQPWSTSVKERVVETHLEITQGDNSETHT